MPAEPHRADARAQAVIRGPAFALPEYPERGVVTPSAPRAALRSRSSGGSSCESSAMRRLDESGDARGGLRVADVGFDRADDGGGGRRVCFAAGAEIRACSSVASPTLGAGAVPLEVGDRLDAEAGARVGATQGEQLPLDLGARDAAAAVGRDAPAADDRVDAAPLGAARLRAASARRSRSLRRARSPRSARRRRASRRAPARRPWRTRPARTGRGSGRRRPRAPRRDRPRRAPSRR